MITGFVDLDRHQLLDVVPGRSGQVVRDWLDQRADEWLAGIGVAVVDPFRGYATGLADRLDGVDDRGGPLPRDPTRVTRPSTTCVAACNRPRSGIGAANTIRSIGSAAPCWSRTTGSPNPNVNASCACCSKAIPTVKSAPRTSPRSCCARSTRREACELARRRLQTLLRVLRRQPGARVPSSRPHDPIVGERGPRLPHHRRVKRRRPKASTC